MEMFALPHFGESNESKPFLVQGTFIPGWDILPVSPQMTSH